MIIIIIIIIIIIMIIIIIIIIILKNECHKKVFRQSKLKTEVKVQYSYLPSFKSRLAYKAFQYI